MAQNSQADFVTQIQPLAIFFQNVHHPQRLLVVPEWLAQDLAEGIFTGMAKGGVSQVVSQSNGFA